MNYRKVEIYNGMRFHVPDHITRCDYRGSHAWQVRYSKPWVSFADSLHNGPKAALAEATAELIRQMAAVPAASGLRQKTTGRKGTELPVGISGPYERSRNGTNYSEFVIQVSVPRYPEGSTCKKVYIGTSNTITEKRIREAIKKAISIRKDAEEAYELAKTAARQKEARLLKRKRKK